MNINEVLSKLHTGTEHYYALKRFPNVLLTDGVQDAIVKYSQISIMVEGVILLSQKKGTLTELKQDDTQFWKCRMNKDTMSSITLEDGNYNALAQIPAPLAPFLAEDLELTIWAAWSVIEDKDVMVFYLPSEH